MVPSRENTGLYKTRVTHWVHRRESLAQNKNVIQEKYLNRDKRGVGRGNLNKNVHGAMAYEKHFSSGFA